MFYLLFFVMFPGMKGTENGENGTAKKLGQDPADGTDNGSDGIDFLFLHGAGRAIR
jgi:hypothetical protein